MENRITGQSPQRIVDEVDLTDNLSAQELCEQVDLLTAEARESLLQKALAVSNEKCNGLISRLNALVEELTQQVKSVKLSVYDVEGSVKEENEIVLKGIEKSWEQMLNKIRTEVRELQSLTAQIQAEVRAATAKATDEASDLLTERINEMADGVIQRVNVTVNEATSKVKAAEQEVNRVKNDIQYERGFRKFMFWLTPLMLAVQSILTVLVLLKQEKSY